MPMRIVEKKTEAGGWENTILENLHKGEVFRMFEPDGEPVKDVSGATEFIAASEPYRVSMPEPVWGVEIVANPGF